jgi:hypothetical protein
MYGSYGTSGHVTKAVHGWIDLQLLTSAPLCLRTP